MEHDSSQKHSVLENIRFIFGDISSEQRPLLVCLSAETITSEVTLFFHPS